MCETMHYQTFLRVQECIWLCKY